MQKGQGQHTFRARDGELFGDLYEVGPANDTDDNLLAQRAEKGDHLR